MNSVAKLESLKGNAAIYMLQNFEQSLKLADIDPEMAIVRLRKVLELGLRDYCKRTGADSGTKPLANVIAELTKSGVLSGRLCGHFKLLTDMGNVAAHSAGDGARFALTRSDFDQCVISIDAAIDWYCLAISGQKTTRNFKILDKVSPEDVNIIGQIQQIDKLVYPEEWLKPEIYYTWLERNPDILTVVVDADSERVAGYINSMPIDDVSFETIKNGDFARDLDMPVEMIRRLEIPDFFKLYLCSIAVHPERSGTKAFSVLFDGFIDKLLKFSELGYYATDIIADAVTNDGIRLCEHSGLIRLRSSTHGSSIYTAQLLPPQFRATTVKALIIEKKLREIHSSINAR